MGLEGGRGLGGEGVQRLGPKPGIPRSFLADCGQLPARCGTLFRREWTAENAMNDVISSITILRTKNLAVVCIYFSPSHCSLSLPVLPSSPYYISLYILALPIMSFVGSIISYLFFCFLFLPSVPSYLLSSPSLPILFSSIINFFIYSFSLLIMSIILSIVSYLYLYCSFLFLLSLHFPTSPFSSLTFLSSSLPALLPLYLSC